MKYPIKIINTGKPEYGFIVLQSNREYVYYYPSKSQPKEYYYPGESKVTKDGIVIVTSGIMSKEKIEMLLSDPNLYEVTEDYQSV